MPTFENRIDGLNQLILEKWILEMHQNSQFNISFFTFLPSCRIVNGFGSILKKRMMELPVKIEECKNADPDYVWLMLARRNDLGSPPPCYILV